MSNHQDSIQQSKKLKSYVIGFVLSIMLAMASFTLVNQHALDQRSLYIVVALITLLQLAVLVICFLRLNTGPEDEGRWNLISLLFTIFVVVVVVSGSLWIMWNLNYNMVH